MFLLRLFGLLTLKLRQLCLQKLNLRLNDILLFFLSSTLPLPLGISFNCCVSLTILAVMRLIWAAISLLLELPLPPLLLVCREGVDV